MEYLNFVGGQGLCTVYSRVMSNSYFWDNAASEVRILGAGGSPSRRFYNFNALNVVTWSRRNLIIIL